MEASQNVTDETFNKEVLASDKPVVVDFWAEWCTPCRKIEQLLDQIATTELGEKVRFAKMNIDTSPQTAERYKVMSVPTVTVFKAGTPVQSFSGAQPRGELIRMIESALT